MEKTTLLEVINSIKYDTLQMYSIYFNSASIGSTVTVLHQREMLKALSIYIQVLEYFYGVFEDWEDLDVQETKVDRVIGKATSILRTFKIRYYD